MFEQSENIADLAAALAKAQAIVEGAKKDSANPHFKSKYADLASTWDACREALTANGLSVLQSPGLCHDGVMHMTTQLSHASGQWIRGEMSVPLSKVDAQGYGSATTYARRYSLAAFVGVAPEDDDGNAASRPAANAPANDKPAKRVDPPFPQGPARNITALKDMGRDLIGKVRAAQDVDHLSHIKTENAALITQMQEALPDWWNGGRKFNRETGEEESYEGLNQLIDRVEHDFNAPTYFNAG